jgi:hypothetical protein
MGHLHFDGIFIDPSARNKMPPLSLCGDLGANGLSDTHGASRISCRPSHLLDQNERARGGRGSFFFALTCRN